MSRRQKRREGMPFRSWYALFKNLQIPHMPGKYPRYIQTAVRASPRVFGRGSLTVETALALPFLLCAAAALICLFACTSVQAKENRALWEKAEILAVTAGQAAKEDPYIRLYDPSVVSLPFSFLFPGGRLTAQRAVVRAWTGYTGESFRAGNKSEEFVYITPEGSVCHKSRDCSYLRLSVRSISGSGLANARNESGAKYYPCEYCVKNAGAGAAVYITEYGTSYHNSPNCQGLKRTVMAVPLSEVGRPLCSRCGGS